MYSKDEIPPAAEFGRLRAFLALKGIPQSWINQYTDNSKTRQEVANTLKEAMKEFTQ